ncbi:MAG TPA: hypothetical protein VHU80_09135 [Polyangiaceae bacterium]|nr:hypothetical protein [Polyangiaceae bacterium]
MAGATLRRRSAWGKRGLARGRLALQHRHAFGDDDLARGNAGKNALLFSLGRTELDRRRDEELQVTVGDEDDGSPVQPGYR